MEQIDNLFWKIGIAGCKKGCYPLKIAVDLVQRGECDLELVTQCLYPMVAARTGISAIRNERNIRTVINVFWYNGGRECLQEMLGRKIKKKPTTKEFIDILVGCLKHYEQHV